MARPARPTDAEDMAVVQNGIYRAGLRESPVDVALVRRLFTTSLAAAGAGGLKHIDASIGVDNLAALVYCSAIGFTPYREGSDTIPHRFDVYQLVAGASQRIFVSQLRLSIAWPYALFPESSRAMVLALLTTAIAAGGVAAAWVFIAPTGFVFAWVTHFILMAWVLSVVRPRVRIPDYDWLRVRFWELRIYTGLGVRIFGKGLDVIGWNQIIAKERGFDGTRRGLGELDQHTRRSEIGHNICLLVTAALALGILMTGSWAGALWLAALAVPLHLYPTLLQRLLRSRIQAVLSRP
ncbi:MAG: hypothetical protein ACTMHH_01605 [Nesterenkonia sp.]